MPLLDMWLTILNKYVQLPAPPPDAPNVEQEIIEAHRARFDGQQIDVTARVHDVTAIR